MEQRPQPALRLLQGCGNSLPQVWGVGAGAGCGGAALGVQDGVLDFHNALSGNENPGPEMTRLSVSHYFFSVLKITPSPSRRGGTLAPDLWLRVPAGGHRA